MDVAPVVVEDAQACIFELIAQLRVVILKATKLDARRRFNDGLRGTAEENVHLSAIPHSELLTSHATFAVYALAEKHAGLDRSQKYPAVGAVIYGDGGRVVKYIDVAVLTVFNDKLLASNFTRQPSHCLIL